MVAGGRCLSLGQLSRGLWSKRWTLHDRLAVRPRELAESSFLDLIFIHSHQVKILDPWRHRLRSLKTCCDSTLFLNDYEPSLLVDLSSAAG